MLDEEHLAISEMCKNFADNELAPQAGMIDKNHTFPEEQIKQMGSLGLMGMTVSSDYGGTIAVLSHCFNPCTLRLQSSSCATQAQIWTTYHMLLLWKKLAVVAHQLG